MGCCSPPPWLTPRPPPKRHFLCRQAFFSSLSPSSRDNFFFSLSGCSSSASDPTDSPSSLSTPTSSRRWYNPLRRRPYGHPSPELLRRQWIESDDTQQPSASQVMKWAHRQRILCEELIGYSPDIICLQEVDNYFDLLKVMEKAGYAGSYKRRTGDYVDGCATFWKDKFRLLEEESIEFKGLGLRDNVAQLSVFEICRVESRRIVVGNIHVLYNPSRGEVKLGQLRFLLSRAQSLSGRWGNIPVVMAGDFNSTPQSAIYKFLSLSELNILLYERRELSGQRKCHPAEVFGIKREMKNTVNLMDRFWTDEEVKVATGNKDCHLAVHPLRLDSAYASVKGSTRTRDLIGEPLATSYHSKFLGTVDYLWYSDGLLPVRVLDSLPLDILKKTGGLPCSNLGSDHLALACEFAFTQGNEGSSTDHFSSAPISESRDEADSA